MLITIEALNDNNISHVNKVNGEFIIDANLVLTVENTEIQYKIVPQPPTIKNYSPAALDYPTYINDPDKAIYLAYADNTLAGQIVLYKYWNNFAYIFELLVDIDYRGRGIGRKLMDQAKKWAKARNLAGLMLETQSNNVQASKFYEQYGFVIGGFDKYLYSGDPTVKNETAIFWYYHFDEVVSKKS
jgi:ribosomal protein S18 acetylase RimI-like enzyme